MKTIYLATILFFISVEISFGQYYQQYFDGADTNVSNSIFIQLDTSSSNIWQIGRPQKIIFDSASTFPNAIVTDTIHNYPVNNISRFTFKVVPFFSWGIFAMQWVQKLDMDLHHDGGLIEYSVDTGNTWHNVFNDPHIYQFYGYQQANQDTLLSGEYAFSGTDSTWRNVWLCMDMSWMTTFNDSIYIRFSLKSDSINNNREGWLIDNLIAQITLMHPVKEANKKDYMNVYPNPSKDIINIEFQKIQDFHIIEKMDLINSDGKLVDHWENIPTKFWFDVHKYSDGFYFLKVKTNIKSETIPIIIKKN